MSCGGAQHVAVADVAAVVGLHAPEGDQRSGRDPDAQLNLLQLRHGQEFGPGPPAAAVEQPLHIVGERLVGLRRRRPPRDHHRIGDQALECKRPGVGGDALADGPGPDVAQPVVEAALRQRVGVVEGGSDGLGQCAGRRGERGRAEDQISSPHPRSLCRRL